MQSACLSLLKHRFSNLLQASNYSRGMNCPVFSSQRKDWRFGITRQTIWDKFRKPHDWGYCPIIRTEKLLTSVQLSIQHWIDFQLPSWVNSLASVQHSTFPSALVPHQGVGSDSFALSTELQTVAIAERVLTLFWPMRRIISPKNADQRHVHDCAQIRRREELNSAMLCLLRRQVRTRRLCIRCCSSLPDSWFLSTPWTSTRVVWNFGFLSRYIVDWHLKKYKRRRTRRQDPKENQQREENKGENPRIPRKTKQRGENKE